MGSTGLSHSHWLPLGNMYVLERRQKQMKQMQKSYLHFIWWMHSGISLFRIQNTYSHLWNARDQNIQELNLHNIGLSLPPHRFMYLFIQQLFIKYHLCARHQDQSNEQNRIRTFIEPTFQGLCFRLIRYLPQWPASKGYNLSSATNWLLNLGTLLGFHFLTY